MDTDAAIRALHAAVHDLFDEDDGSLPEVQIEGVSSNEAQAIFDAVQRISAPLGPTQTVWDEQRGQDVPIRDHVDAARLAADGHLATLHCLFQNIRWRGDRIPDLGVSIWPKTVALDYRPGPEWSPHVTARFVDLLAALLDLCDEADVVLADEVSSPLPANTSAASAPPSRPTDTPPLTSGPRHRL